MQSPQIYLYAFTAMAIIGLVVAVVYAGKDMLTAFDELESKLVSSADQAARDIAQLSDYIGTGFQTVWDAIEYATNILTEYLSTSAAIAGKALEDAFGSFFRAASGWLQSALQSVIEAVNSAARTIADGLKVWLQSVTSALSQLSKAMLQQVVRTVRPITSELCHILHQVVGTLYDLLSNFEGFFTDRILPLLEEALRWIRDLFDSIGKTIEDAFDTVKNFFVNLFNSIVGPIEDFIEDIAKTFISGSCSFFRELNNASQHVEHVIDINLFPCSTIHDALYGANNEYCTLYQMCDIRTYTPTVTMQFVNPTTPEIIDIPQGKTPTPRQLYLMAFDGTWSLGLACSFLFIPADGPGGTYQTATCTFTADYYDFDEGTGGTTLPIAKWTRNVITNAVAADVQFGGYLPYTTDKTMISITAEFKTTTLEYNSTYRFQTIQTAGVVDASESVSGFDEPVIGDTWRITWPSLYAGETFRILTITHIGPMDAYENSPFGTLQVGMFPHYQIKIHESTVDPTPGDGSDGDYWLNTTTQTQFGPKASGSWPSGVSLGFYGIEFPIEITGSTPLVYNDYYTFGIRAFFGTSPDPPSAEKDKLWVSELLRVNSFVQVSNIQNSDTVYVPYATIDVVPIILLSTFDIQIELLPLPSGTPIVLIPVTQINGNVQIQWPVDTPEGNYDLKISHLTDSFFYTINNITLTHKLQVTSPTTAAQYLGYPVPIQWSDWNATLAEPTMETHVDIDLYHPTHGVLSVATNVLTTYGTNTLNWSIPVTVTADIDYQIRVTSIEFPAMIRYSAQFPIENPIVVTGPAPATNFYANDTLPVTWTYSAASDTAALKIILQSVNTAQHAYTAITSTDNDGIFTWAIPSDVIHDDYQVQVQHVSKGLTATSGAITINENNPMVFLETVAAIQYLGQDLLLHWRYDTGGAVAYTAVSARQGLDYSTSVPGYSNIFPGLINDDVNGNQQTWTVPVLFPIGSNYRIIIHAPGVSLTTPAFEVVHPIELTVPAAGAVIQKDTDVELTWTYANGVNTSNIQIDLVNDVNTYPLSASTPNAGAETTVTVNIPNTVVVPAAYHIQLTDLSNGLVYQSGAISVVTPISISQPVASLQHTRNTNLTVEWDYNNNANMLVELFNNSNTYVLASAVTNIIPTTTTNINVPNTVELGDYQLRVTDMGLGCFQVSDTFSIVTPINVTVPAAGAVQQRNTNMTVTWTYAGGVPTSNMTVELINANNTYTLIPTTLNDGATTTRVALVPNTVLVPAAYQVRVIDTDVNYQNDSGLITVTYPLTLSQPTGALVQPRGTTMTVTWAYGGSENMTITLMNTDNVHSYVLQPVTPNTPPTKTMNVYVPTLVLPGSYRVRVASMNYALYVDSDVFTVTS
jgi:hypothetical protein